MPVLVFAAAALGCTATGADRSRDPAPRPVPAKRLTLSNTQDSIYALADSLVRSITAGDLDGLLAQGVDESEWYWIVWRELPSSRPGRGVPWDYAWLDLWQKSRNSARRTISRYRGRNYRLLRVEFEGETTCFRTYRVYRDARVVVENEAGTIERLDLFGSILERRGHFKAFSFVVD